MSAPGLPHFERELRIAHQNFEAGDQAVEILGRNKIAGMLVDYNVVSGADASCHYRTAARHCFQRHQPKTLPTLRCDDDANAPKPERDLSRGPFTEKPDPLRQTSSRDDALEVSCKPSLVRCRGADDHGGVVGKFRQ